MISSQAPEDIVPPTELGPEAPGIRHGLELEVARNGLIHGDGAGLLAAYCRFSVQWQDISARLRRDGKGLSRSGA